jgi:hypothetical protein
MTKLWLNLSSLIFINLLGTGCLPHPESTVQKASPLLAIKGRVQHNNDNAGPTAIYIEQTPTPETLSAEDGSFAFAFDADRLEAMRLQYGLQDDTLHLYFISDSKNRESAVVSKVSLQYRGEMDLGTVAMQAETEVRGRVIAQGRPIADARVRLGRKEVFTDAEGNFSSTLPMASVTPILVEKSGFVQTKGLWSTSSESRDLELFTDLAPIGSISALLSPKGAFNQSITLNYSGTGTVRWIRFAKSASALQRSYEPDSPWLDVKGSLQVDRSDNGVIFYQCADKDQKIFGPVQSMVIAPAR